MEKVALITGGTRGIGLGIASSLSQEGFHLALCGRRKKDEIPETLDALRFSGLEVLYIQADIGKSEDRERLLETIREHYGRLHVLVNNAGVAPLERRDLLHTTEDSFDHVININLKGPFFLTRSVANWMVEQKLADRTYGGTLINITSVSATVASPERGEYCVSKAGLSMVSQLWAVRLSEYGIPVYEIRPGITRTDMTLAVQAKYDRMISEGLLLQPRWGLPEDIGKAVAMLVRGDLAYSSGQVIYVDGGMTVGRL